MNKFEERDIRNYSYTSNKGVLSFDNLEDFDIFIDYIYNLFSFFDHVLICDILGYFGVDHDFEAAYQYGWDINDINNSVKYCSDNMDRIVLRLPQPKYVVQYYNEIHNLKEKTNE